ncbi:NAD(P)H-dependent glycerol-3-phosphate dehydrogenase [Rhodovulum adriaticum]|uniref:Glycerol-3-phosphate dehydrogenase [NAD(P)+] n=1 Tax=Rhodovulum adriaticum TaxID=35804 RepID=A0A4R2NZG0_RHOAD|nr:NAD(P)H-dependent glycerol-3-phosphate dehydrogenase [Rhodovulum adriaticum]MBK1634853.1 glycerol-3-phosphate dehydrogenase [Rhodovulum adriaticum]TCP27567.1 glycerol-3-phosphate dehydrogenase (NAD(P)+) [Rhodovulum adriaticum]
MSRIAIAGAGAFGTALAVTLAQAGRPVTLWARNCDAARDMVKTRENLRLPGVPLPENVTVTADLDALRICDPVLLSVPMQALAGFLRDAAATLDGRALVACCKGVDMTTGRGPTAIIAGACPTAVPAVLTGPSFAADIARGLPTALTLACVDPDHGTALQERLSTPTLRLYRSGDPVGAELGGALKNIMAIAAGIVIGAGLGDSARAALMTRGFAEMQRFARAQGAEAETLAGLSGFGDLVLTCTSTQSRNFRYGAALGQGAYFDPQITVEGAATARAVAAIAQARGIDMPVTQSVAQVIDGQRSIAEAVTTLLSRPLKEE